MYNEWVRCFTHHLDLIFLVNLAILTLWLIRSSLLYRWKREGRWKYTSALFVLKEDLFLGLVGLFEELAVRIVPVSVSVGQILVPLLLLGTHALPRLGQVSHHVLG